MSITSAEFGGMEAVDQLQKGLFGEHAHRARWIATRTADVLLAQDDIAEGFGMSWKEVAFEAVMEQMDAMRVLDAAHEELQHFAPTYYWVKAQ